MNLRLYLSEVKKGDFDFEKAVCNHGYFMMAPNVWNPKRKSLSRPLTLANSSSTMVTISHPSIHPFLVIQVHGIDNVRRDDETLIFQQVRRMLRFTTEDQRDVADFHQLHDSAKESGFGRIFRSPSLFEDMVKSILLCNSTWEKTLGMASNLCKMQSKLADLRSKKRKRDPKPEIERPGNFPSVKEIASLDKEFINEHCKLGYRAKWIVALAKKVERGTLDLEEIEKREIGPEQVIGKLKPSKGFGVFVTATVLMCIGYYHVVPSDTETLRLLREMHGMEECSTQGREAQQLYDRFSPFQSLAYWFDMVKNYETKHGKLSELSPLYYNKVGGCHPMKQTK